MVKFYFRMIKNGTITIDDVPAKYKDAVKEMYLELYGVEL